jgi:amino acid transporter
MSVPLRRPARTTTVVPVSAVRPRPVLGLADVVALIVGTVVGAGIFRTPPLVAANAGSEILLLAAWALGGAISLMGALCYAELASAYPSVGGEYHYLTRAFGEKTGFLFVWARMSVIQTGSIALLAYVLGDYASQLYRLGPHSPAIYAALAIVVLTALNTRGVRQGKTAQKLLTTIEVVGIVTLIAIGFLFAGARQSEGAPAAEAAATPAFGLVMVFVLLAYGGWNEAAYVSAEVRDARRNMTRALLLSLGLVTALYVAMNWALVAVLGLSGVARSKAVAADLVQRTVGGPGAQLVSLLIVIAAATSANAALFTGGRALYAFGRDFRTFAPLGRWHARSGTPATALRVQGAIALALVLFGALTRRGFETMVDYTAPVFWLFFMLTGISLLVLRVREPGAPRPFRVPLYPLTPLAFCATSAYLLYSSIMYTGVGALAGLGVLASGAIVFGIAYRRRRRRSTS